jgi:nicotinamidase-related amidase
MKSPRLSKENAIILIIDPQEKLLPKVFEPARVTANIILLIRFADIAGIPLVVTTQYEKGIGPIVEEIQGEMPGQSCLDKVEFGCFNNPEFLKRMEDTGGFRNCLVLSGIESHICVAQTALGALEAGHNVHVASDAVSSRTPWNWHIGLDRMKQAGAVISSTEMVIFEILKRSDVEEFKAMLPHLRDPVT